MTVQICRLLFSGQRKHIVAAGLISLHFLEPLSTVRSCFVTRLKLVRYSVCWPELSCLPPSLPTFDSCAYHVNAAWSSDQVLDPIELDGKFLEWMADVVQLIVTRFLTGIFLVDWIPMAMVRLRIHPGSKIHYALESGVPSEYFFRGVLLDTAEIVRH